MSRNTKITMSRGGTGEHVVEAGKISVPDLWKVAQALRNNEKIHSDNKTAGSVLKCWNLCHDLLNHILTQPD